MPRRVLSLLPALLLMLAVVLPVMAWRGELGRGYYDQNNYHWRVVTKFAAEMPRPDVSDYVSATTPLYHLLLAAVHRWVTPDVTAHRLIGTLVAIGLLGVVWRFVSARAGASETARLLLPLASSMYVLDAAIWILPDNAAWIWVALLLGVGMRARMSAGVMAACGAALCVLVLTRQSHLWCAAIVWLAAWLDADPAPGLFTHAGKRVARTALAIGVTIPAFLIVAWFWKLWGGRLTPPVFDPWFTGRKNPTAPAFVLSLAGIYSVFFAGYLWPAFRELVMRRRGLLVAVLVGAAAIAVLPRTNYDLEEGRYGGIWAIAAKLPMVAGDRSVFIVATTLAGAVAVACWGLALPHRARWVFLGALAAFTAAQCLNPWVYQRYVEPLLLMLVIMGAVEAGAAETDGAGAGRSGVLGHARRVGPVALAALLLAVALNSYRTAAPQVELPPGTIDTPPKNPPAVRP